MKKLVLSISATKNTICLSLSSLSTKYWILQRIVSERTPNETSETDCRRLPMFKYGCGGVYVYLLRCVCVCIYIFFCYTINTHPQSSAHTLSPYQQNWYSSIDRYGMDVDDGWERGSKTWRRVKEVAAI